MTGCEEKHTTFDDVNHVIFELLFAGDPILSPNSSLILQKNNFSHPNKEGQSLRAVLEFFVYLEKRAIFIVYHTFSTTQKVVRTVGPERQARAPNLTSKYRNHRNVA